MRRPTLFVLNQDAVVASMGGVMLIEGLIEGVEGT